jgi:hypothetical protein
MQVEHHRCRLEAIATVGAVRARTLPDVGRLPKPPDQVRRPERQRWRRLDAPTSPDVPALLEREDGAEWTAEAVATWGEWWASPMSSMWLEADAVALRRAIRLVDDAARGRRGTDAALVALLDRLGLTPVGRLRLQWMAEPEPKRPAIIVALPARGDPRRRGS